LKEKRKRIKTKHTPLMESCLYKNTFSLKHRYLAENNPQREKLIKIYEKIDEKINENNLIEKKKESKRLKKLEQMLVYKKSTNKKKDLEVVKDMNTFLNTNVN